jgi:hypothetical protein
MIGVRYFNGEDSIKGWHFYKKILMISKEYTEAVNQRTANEMAKEKRQKDK